MDRYKARINLRGFTERERALSRLRDNLSNRLPASLSYKEVVINGTPDNLVILSSTMPYYKEFKTLPGHSIKTGDYVEWGNSIWLVVDCESDDEIYKYGKLNECNWLLKWQNDKGDIIERWCVVASASKYNDGTDGTKTLTLGSDQISIVLPVDEETLKIRKRDRRKFFVDYATDEPTVYEITNPANVFKTFNGNGVTAWIAKECAYTPTAEELELGVCQYTPTAEPVTPDTEPFDDVSMIINGDDTIPIGKSRTYTVTFMRDGEEIPNPWFIHRWVIVSNFTDKIVTSNTIETENLTINISDKSLIGRYFILRIMVDDVVVGEKQIRIRSLYE